MKKQSDQDILFEDFVLFKVFENNSSTKNNYCTNHNSIK